MNKPIEVRTGPGMPAGSIAARKGLYRRFATKAMQSLIASGERDPEKIVELSWEISRQMVNFYDNIRVTGC